MHIFIKLWCIEGFSISRKGGSGWPLVSWQGKTWNFSVSWYLWQELFMEIAWRCREKKRLKLFSSHLTYITRKRERRSNNQFRFPFGEEKENCTHVWATEKKEEDISSLSMVKGHWEISGVKRSRNWPQSRGRGRVWPNPREGHGFGHSLWTLTQLYDVTHVWPYIEGQKKIFDDALKKRRRKLTLNLGLCAQRNFVFCISPRPLIRPWEFGGREKKVEEGGNILRMQLRRPGEKRKKKAQNCCFLHPWKKSEKMQLIGALDIRGRRKKSECLWSQSYDWTLFTKYPQKANYCRTPKFILCLHD